MKTKRYQRIIYFISITILTTIAVQFYWNYKNYQQNKQRVMNEIQTSLDNAIGQYFADLSRSSFFAVVKDGQNQDASHKIWNKIFNALPNKEKDSVNLLQETDSSNTTKVSIKSLQITTDENQEFKDITSNIKSNFKIEGYSYSFSDKDTIAETHFLQDETGIHIHNNSKKSNVKVFTGKKATDSLKLIKGLETVFIAVQNDTLNHQKIDSILRKDLSDKKINILYDFEYFNFKNDTIHTKYQPVIFDEFEAIESKSTFLGSDKKFTMKYSNPSKEAFKRSLSGIFLSFLLSLAVISSLFYLLKIINDQKELAEIKNDLISNITHEFKTPITTVATALEAINNFNAIDDKEKTKKYVSISESQIKKLHVMVEKLLETATLDSEKLLLKEEDVDIVNLLEKLTKKHQLFTTEKEIDFKSNIENLIIKADEFHLENAISNLIDNAIKYGGEKIKVLLNNTPKKLQISISDNGSGIEKNQQEKIFDKFYRVPKGNTHDVKGFGIGLYYTKKIVEKHNGTIHLASTPGETTFKIIMSHE